MKYTACNTLNKNQLSQLENNFICKDTDYIPFFTDKADVSYPAFHFIEEDDRIISFLGLMPSGGNISEITAFTLYDYRHQGLFKELLKKTLENTQSVTLLSDCRLNFDFIKNEYSHSEYMMQLTPKDFNKKLRVSSGYELEEYVYISEGNKEYVYVLKKDTVALGLLKIIVTERSACLHHVMIRRPFRKLGHGKRLLTGALHMFYENHSCDIILHVTGTNIAAVNLYRKMNFKIIQTVDYYHVRLLSDQ